MHNICIISLRRDFYRMFAINFTCLFYGKKVPFPNGPEAWATRHYFPTGLCTLVLVLMQAASMAKESIRVSNYSSEFSNRLLLSHSVLRLY